MLTKTPHFLLNLLMLLCLLNCNDSSNIQQANKTELAKLKKQKIIIEGRIDTLYEELFSLTSKFKSEVIHFDSNTFKFVFEEDLPILVKISNSKLQSIPIFAIPGDSIHLSFKLDDLSNGINRHKFTGSSTKENIVLSRLNEISTLNKQSLRSINKLEEFVLLNKLDSIKSLGEKIIKEVDNFYSVKYFNVFFKCKINEILHGHAIHKKDSKNLNLEPRHNHIIEENPNWLNIYSYVEYLMNQINTKAGIASVPNVKFQMIDSIYKNKEVNEFCKYYVIQSELETARLIQRIKFKEKEENDLPTIRSNSMYLIDELDKAISFYKMTNPPVELLNKIEEGYNELIN